MNIKSVLVKFYIMQEIYIFIAYKINLRLLTHKIINPLSYDLFNNYFNCNNIISNVKY